LTRSEDADKLYAKKRQSSGPAYRIQRLEKLTQRDVEEIDSEKYDLSSLKLGTLKESASNKPDHGKVGNSLTS